MKILVAEDSSTVRLILHRLFSKLDHEVVLTANGQSAWEAYQKEYFPILVTDWHMPQMDGMTLTKMVRLKPYERYTYVILLTGHGGNENYMEGIKAGADDFILKPPDLDQLRARLIVAERIVGVQNHVRKLETLISVCSYCKSVRENGIWISLEQLLYQRLGNRPSHGICPTCWETKVKPELSQYGIPFPDAPPS